MTSSSRPPRVRPRSTRNALETLEDRQLLAADEVVNQALDLGIVALVVAGKIEEGALFNVSDIKKLDGPGPGSGPLLEQRDNSTTAAAAGPLWGEAWSDVLTVKDLLVRAVAIAEGDDSPHGSPEEDQALAQIQELTQQARPILERATQETFQILPLVAQAREDTTWYPGKPADPAPAPTVPGSGTPTDPFRVGADQGAIKVGDTLTLPGGVRVQVDAGGAPPVEAGVDWDGWYRNQLIPTVQAKVFKPMVAAFPGVRDRLEVTLTYEIFKDGRTVAVITHVEGSPAQGQPQNVFRKNVSTWANSAKNLMPGLGVPLPANTKMPSLIRTFTFSLKSDGPDVHLGGPPKEGKGPGSHLDPRSGLRVQQIRTVRPRGPQLALSKGVRWSRSSTA